MGSLCEPFGLSVGPSVLQLTQCGGPPSAQIDIAVITMSEWMLAHYRIGAEEKLVLKACGEALQVRGFAVRRLL